MALKILMIFVIGLLAGWLIEWVIDWVYWRKPPKNAGPRQYQAQFQKTTSNSLERAHINSRLEMLATTNPALGDVVASMLSRPELIDKTPDVKAARLQADLANWFDDVMERSSGDYKRKARKWAWLLGTILAFALNVDSLEIATRLWREPTVRQVIVAQAQSIQDGGEITSSDEIMDQVNQLGIPVGWTTALPMDGQPCGWTPGQAVYPAIWSNETCKILINLPRMDDGWGWLLKIIGLLISGIAAAQGAPFWFDILNKVFNLRSSGKVPKSSRDIPAGAQ